jgi:hypothetical protein
MDTTNQIRSYRFNVNNVRNPPINGVIRQDIQGLIPDLVGKRCAVSWGSLQLEMSNRLSNAVGMVANGTGTASKNLVVKTVSALVLGPVGTTGTLVVAGSGNTATTFIVNSATSLTLGSDQTWVDDAAVTIGHVDNGSDKTLITRENLAIHTNFQDTSGNTELLRIDHSKTQDFANGFKFLTDIFQGSTGYVSYVQPYIEVFLTDDFITNTDNRQLVVNGTSEFKGLIHSKGTVSTPGYINIYAIDKNYHTSLYPTETVNANVYLPNISTTLVGVNTIDTLTGKTLE